MPGTAIFSRQEKQIFVKGLGIGLIKDPAIVPGIEKAFGFSERRVELVTHPALNYFKRLDAYGLLRDGDSVRDGRL